MAHHLLFLRASGSSLLSSLSKKLHLASSPSPLFSSCYRTAPRATMAMSSASDSSPLTHSLALTTQPGQSVTVVATPGISDSQFRGAIESSLFKQWLKNLESETGVLANGAASLKQVLIQGVDMFGNRIGFLKFKADIIDKETGNKIPGIVFARGPAVAVLILLESDEVTYAVLTEQARVPVGRCILELPAGMLNDDKSDFVGTAIREVEEETGIQLKLEDMVDLTAFTGGHVFPSPGGCNEELSIFLYRSSVDKEIIEQLQGKETGLHEHGELIKVRVVPYEKLWCTTADAKALMAIALYEKAKKERLIL